TAIFLFAVNRDEDSCWWNRAGHHRATARKKRRGAAFMPLRRTKSGGAPTNRNLGEITRRSGINTLSLPTTEHPLHSANGALHISLGQRPRKRAQGRREG